ncbi:MAG: biotin attachment protein, partial [Desulfofustis sp.]|nr:biotin attachment protein [Desulfofustis sp.]
KATPAAPAAAPAPTGPRSYSITVNNRIYDVTVAEGSGAVQAAPAAAPAAPAAAPAAEAPVTGGTEIEAPTPGNVVKIMVKVGDTITKDQPLLVLEAMKMESEVKSPSDGKILSVNVSTGDTVQASDVLFTIG